MIARVIAVNEIDEGEPSLPSTDPVSIVSVPSKPATPTRNSASTTSKIAIDLYPTSLGGLALEGYIVYWDEGNGGDPTTAMPITTDPYQEFEGVAIVPGEPYRFKYTVKNDIGEGPPSEILELIAAVEPSEPDPPVTTIEGTQVKIDWDAPFDGESDILTYSIKIEDLVGNLHYYT